MKNIALLNDSFQSFLVLILAVTVLYSCDGLMENKDDDDDDDSAETINTSSDRVSAHFPEFGEVITSQIDSVTLEITETSLINSKSLYCEIFQYPLSDSAWFTYSSVQFRSGEGMSLACADPEYEILYTEKKAAENGVVFSVTGGCLNQDAHIQPNYNYLVHVYDDEMEVKFYWTFTRK